MRRLARILLAATLAATGAVTAPAATAPAYALDDGLALVPPMGFNNWNSTHCRADFNEEMIKGIADIFISAGLKDVGYEYVNIDDCWALPERNADGDLVPDPVRFPSGIKALADYVHGKGLKFGIYTSAGTKTCNPAGFPGALGHEQRDANLFASWGVDYLKYDNCNNQGVDAIARYTAMRDALKATGRPIVFSICEWGQNDPWMWAEDVGHLWRTTGDISDNWSSMLGIAKQNMPLAQYAGPGHWNDPDMLEVGNGGMTDTEYRSHFSLWAIMAAPLLIGTDLRDATPATLDILRNADVIAVDQDPLGKQGTVLSAEGGRYVIVKELAGGDRAVALFNETDTPQRITARARDLGLPAAPAYRIRDLWAHADRHTAGTVQATVPPHGTAMFRVSLDRRWAAYAPAVDAGVEAPAAYPGGLPLAAPGAETAVTTTVTNTGVLPVFTVRAGLAAPAGWRVRATSRRGTPLLFGHDRTFTATWAVTPPAGTPPGRYELPAEVTYRTVPGGGVTVPAATYVVVPPPAPPAGTGFLSGLPWLQASNGWGPVEIDRSNGEQGAGDGNPITINGTVYARGLGVHAASSVAYFTGGRCSAVTASVGVDDEEGADGTVSFQIWADGRRVADSGVLTNAMAAASISADVTGASVITLVVTDGGDGVTSDHGDWADLQITCQ